MSHCLISQIRNVQKIFVLMDMSHYLFKSSRKKTPEIFELLMMHNILEFVNVMHSLLVEIPQSLKKKNEWKVEILQGLLLLELV